jgi:hypothetical protein
LIFDLGIDDGLNSGIGLPKYEGLSLALEELRSSAKAKDNIKDEL